MCRKRSKLERLPLKKRGAVHNAPKTTRQKKIIKHLTKRKCLKKHAKMRSQGHIQKEGIVFPCRKSKLRKQIERFFGLRYSLWLDKKMTFFILICAQS